MSPPRKKQNEELEQQLLSLLKGTLGGVDRKVTSNTKQINTNTNKLADHEERIEDLESEVFKKPVVPAKLPLPWKDPKNFKIILLIILALVLLALAFKGIDATKLLGGQ